MCGIEQKLYARMPIGSGAHDNSSYPVGTDTLELRSGSNAQRHGELAGAWLASLLSDHTVRAYRRDLTELFDFLDLGGVDVLMAGRKHLDAWRRSMTGSTTTVARKLSAASSFFRYAMEVDAIEYNPITRVRRPKIDPDFTKTQGLTRRQAEDFLAAAAADGPRSDALSNVLLLTGIRVGEALKSDTDDLRFESGHRVLAITRKGGWAGRVVLPSLAVDALARYLGKGAAEGTELARTSAEISHPIFTTSTAGGGSSPRRTERLGASPRTPAFQALSRHTPSVTPTRRSRWRPASASPTCRTHSGKPILGQLVATIGRADGWNARARMPSAACSHNRYGPHLFGEYTVRG